MLKFILIFLFTQNLYAWTLLANPPLKFSSADVVINIASTSCSNAGFSTAELRGIVEEAIEQHWNNVPTTKLHLKMGASDYADIDGLTSTTNVANRTDVNSILIGCNDDVPEFASGGVGGIGGISCNSGDCKGGIILNGHASSALRTQDRNQLKAIIAHEIGHAFGLGHSSDEVALMYYSTSQKIQEDLSQDDYDAVTWLYPQEKKLGGLGGSCGTIDLNQTNANSTFSFLFGLILMLVIKIYAKNKHRYHYIKQR